MPPRRGGNNIGLAWRCAIPRHDRRGSRRPRQPNRVADWVSPDRQLRFDAERAADAQRVTERARRGADAAWGEAEPARREELADFLGDPAVRTIGKQCVSDLVAGRAFLEQVTAARWTGVNFFLIIAIA